MQVHDLRSMVFVRSYWSIIKILFLNLCLVPDSYRVAG